MRNFSIFAAVVLSCSFVTTTTSRADQAEDEAAIRKNDDAYVEAYNKRDAKALAALWSPEAVYVDPETGEEAVGREEIEKEFAKTLESSEGSKLEIDVESRSGSSRPMLLSKTEPRALFAPKKNPMSRRTRHFS